MTTIKPKSAADKDAISALKLAVQNYARSSYNSLFAFGGELMAEADAGIIADVTEALRAVDVDQYGKDANGVDIDAAHDALEMVKPV